MFEIVELILIIIMALLALEGGFILAVIAYKLLKDK